VPLLWVEINMCNNETDTAKINNQRTLNSWKQIGGNISKHSSPQYLEKNVLSQYWCYNWTFTAWTCCDYKWFSMVQPCRVRGSWGYQSVFSVQMGQRVRLLFDGMNGTMKIISGFDLVMNNGNLPLFPFRVGKFTEY